MALAIASPAVPAAEPHPLAGHRSVAPSVVEAFQRGDEWVEVIVTVRGQPAGMPFYRPVIDDPPERREQVLAQVLKSVRPAEAESEMVVLSSYPRLGTSSLRINQQAALRLAEHPLLNSMAVPRRYQQQASLAVDAAAFPPLHAQGWLGAGRKIAVIDGEFQPTEIPAVFAEEHCFCQLDGVPCCPNNLAEQHGPGSAVTSGLTDQEEHGNRVASLAAGILGQSAAPFGSIVAVSTSIQEPDLIAALNYLSTRTDIDAVVMSLGDGGHPGVCDANPGLNALLGPTSALIANGLLVVAAAGNAGGSTAMLSPACLSPVVGVTGTWSCADPGTSKTCPAGAFPSVIWGLSSFSPATEIAAPAGPMSFVTGPVAASGGTSWSAPLVAGCAALLRQAFPGASQAMLRAALLASTATATRPNEGTFPRLDCLQSMNWLAGNAPLPLNQRGITGNWYNPGTGGQGISLEVMPDHYGAGQGVLFGGWFTYDVAPAGGDAKQRWYVLQGTVTTGSSTAQLGIGTSVGGNFNAPPVRPTNQVGTATLTLNSCNDGALSYQFIDGSGRSGTIPLTRLTANVSCTASGAGGGGHIDQFLSGNWYEPTIGGQGMVFEFNPVNPIVFATWFTFVPNGEGGGAETQRWYTLQIDPGAYSPGTRNFYDIPIGLTVGGVFDDAPPSPSIGPVGTANLQVVDCDSMTLGYAFTSGPNAGLTGTISLERVIATPAGCTF